MRILPPPTAVLLATLSAAFPLRAEETAGLPEEPSAPVFAEAVTDTVATGTNLLRLIEPVVPPGPVPQPTAAERAAFSARVAALRATRPRA